MRLPATASRPNSDGLDWKVILLLFFLLGVAIGVSILRWRWYDEHIRSIVRQEIRRE
jgi:hypothetical protein